MIRFHFYFLIQRQCSPFSLWQAESDVKPWYITVTSYGENEMLIRACRYFNVSETIKKISLGKGPITLKGLQHFTSYLIRLLSGEAEDWILNIKI